MFLTEEQFLKAKDLYDKKVAPSPLLAELAVWAKERYHVTVIDYVCDITINNLLRFMPILRDRKEVRSLKDEFNFLPEIQKEFAEKFAELSCKYGGHEEYREAEKIFVPYHDFESDLRNFIINKLARKELEQLAGGIIWRVQIGTESVTIFFETDAQLAECEKNGTCQALQQKCMEIVKKYGDYDIWGKGCAGFFTHERFMREYKGNWQYYFQR